LPGTSTPECLSQTCGNDEPKSGTPQHLPSPPPGRRKILFYYFIVAPPTVTFDRRRPFPPLDGPLNAASDVDTFTPAGQVTMRRAVFYLRVSKQDQTTANRSASSARLRSAWGHALPVLLAAVRLVRFDRATIGPDGSRAASRRLIKCAQTIMRASAPFHPNFNASVFSFPKLRIVACHRQNAAVSVCDN
jgi:hypothetical protein